MLDNFTASLPEWGIAVLFIASIIGFVLGCNLFKKSHLVGIILILLSAIGGYAYVRAGVPDDNPHKWATIMAPVLFILVGITFGSYLEQRSKAEKVENNEREKTN